MDRLKVTEPSTKPVIFYTDAATNHANNKTESFSRKKSFEIINFWNYFRSNYSPNNKKKQQQLHSSPQSNECKLISLPVQVEPTQQQYHRCQRGSSMSENVFRSILQPPELMVQYNDDDEDNNNNNIIISNEGSGGGGGLVVGFGSQIQKYRLQRNSAPTIIQKDKMEKTWERLMKLKNNEKKVKRMTSRSKLKNWMAQHSGFSGNDTDSVCDDSRHSQNNKNNKNESNISMISYNECQVNNLQQIQSGSQVANVVVIIDTPVQTTPSHQSYDSTQTKMESRQSITTSDLNSHMPQSTSNQPQRCSSVNSYVQINQYIPFASNTPQIQIDSAESSPDHSNHQYSHAHRQYSYNRNQSPVHQSQSTSSSNASIFAIPTISTAQQPSTLNKSSSQLFTVLRRNSLVNLANHSKSTIKEESNSDSDIAECQPNYLDQAIISENGKMSVISGHISATNTTVSSLITTVSSGNDSVEDCTDSISGKFERVNSNVNSSALNNRHVSTTGTDDDCDYDDQLQRSIKELGEERLDNDNDNLFESEDGIIDLFPNGAKLQSDASERYYMPRQWRKPDSCSSYSSLNNDECSVSLNSQDGNLNIGTTPSTSTTNNKQVFETRQMEIRPPINYPRKYSLTVPGEPRHMRTLHRRESGSRSPLNSSCGGLSPSELSTPSPSCSNSINDDQSSCSSGGLNTIPIELNRKCTLSVDSLLLRTSSSNRECQKTLDNNKKDLNRLDELCRRLFHLRTSSAASSSNSHHSREYVNSSSPTCKEFDDECDTFCNKEAPKVPKKRKDSMTAIIASLLLPDSICQKIGASFSTDRINQQQQQHQQQQSSPHSSNSPSTSRSISSRNIFTSKGRTSANNHYHHHHHHHHHPSKAERQCDTAGDQPETPPPNVERSRKGSIVQITSASAGKIVRLLRRTHSAGCSKDVPSHALFLGNETKTERKKRQRKERKAKRGHRKQAPALEDMKQRLRFLRRRHTDSSLHSSTVRPSRDEVEKWSKSFRDLMANRYGCALFRAFLSREYSEENIEFWLACEEYRKARSSKMSHKAKKIFENFLAVRSPKEVNLDPQLRIEIQQNLSAPNKFTFDEAQRKIQSLLESDSYVRFLRSDLYTDLVISEIERNAQELNNDNSKNNENENNKPMPTSTSHSLCSSALVNSLSSSVVNQ